MSTRGKAEHGGKDNDDNNFFTHDEIPPFALNSGFRTYFSFYRAMRQRCSNLRSGKGASPQVLRDGGTRRTDGGQTRLPDTDHLWIAWSALIYFARMLPARRAKIAGPHARAINPMPWA